MEYHKVKENKNKKILLAIYLILILSLGYFAFSSFRYNVLYHEAIKQGAEGIVLMAELNVACQSLGNITTEEVKNKWIDMFLKNQTTNEGVKDDGGFWNSNLSGLSYGADNMR